MNYDGVIAHSSEHYPLKTSTESISNNIFVGAYLHRCGSSSLILARARRKSMPACSHDSGVCCDVESAAKVLPTVSHQNLCPICPHAETYQDHSPGASGDTEQSPLVSSRHSVDVTHSALHSLEEGIMTYNN